MRLIFLGTAAARPSKERNVSSSALVIGNRVILVDCGEGTQRQIQWANFSYMKISHVLITHFHLDHLLGLFGLTETMHLDGREKELTIIGPSGTITLVETLQAIGLMKSTFPIKCIEAEEGIVQELKDVTISTFPNTHGQLSQGYVIEESPRPGKFNKMKALQLGIPEGRLFGMLQRGENITRDGQVVTPDMVLGPPRRGRKVAFSGDTYICEDLVNASLGVDVLVHESTYTSEHRHRAEEFFHSTSEMAAEAAKEAGAGTLFLTHFSSRYEDSDRMLSEAKAIFPGAHIAEDLMDVFIPHADSGKEMIIKRFEE